MISAVVAVGLVTRLGREVAEHLHFCRLYRAELSDAIWHALGMRPATPSPFAGTRVPNAAVL
jgi:5,10-methylenetetrahydrofolate reductase